jgi:TolB protein
MDQAKRQRDWNRVVEISSEIIAKHPKVARAWYRMGGAKISLKDYAGAEIAVSTAADLHYDENNCRLNAAMLAAMQGKTEEAFEHLRKLVRNGFAQVSEIEKSDEFAPLRSDPRYVEILRRAKNNVTWQTVDARWSRDGKRIIFARSLSGFPPSRSQIFTIEPDGSRETQLTSDAGNPMMPDFSPDGQQIAYSSGPEGRKKLYIEDLGTRQARLLVSESIGNEHYPSWSPDGTQIAFNADGNGHRQIYVVNIDGSGLRALTEAAHDSDYARWTAGGKITFESDLAGIWDTYVIDRYGGLQSRIRCDASAPDPSADGQKLAFQNLLIAGNWEIYVMNADGTETRRITKNRSNDGKPSLSLDGKEILFTSDRTGHFELYLLNADGTHLRRLTKSRPPRER